MNDNTNLIEDVNHWDSCCGKASDRRLLIFLANLSISFTLLIFSMIRLIEPLQSDEKAFYCSIISLIIGIWVKSPLS